MPRLFLASNSVFVTHYGHIQIVYENEAGDLLELEVQPSRTASGIWVPSPSQPHNVGNPGSYVRTEIVVEPGTTAADIWGVLLSARDDFAAESLAYLRGAVGFELDQNSASYVTTMLSIVGINISDYLASLYAENITSFPGVTHNVLFDAIDGDGNAIPSIGLTINGTQGNNTVIGGESADDLRGSGGDDTLRGHDGNDSLYGGIDSDSLIGDGGDDSLKGEGGADTLAGGIGNDTIYGDGENDSLFGEGGNDYLNGGTGIDTLLGGGDNDVLIGEGGNDTLDGGTGSDIAVYHGDSSSASITRAGTAGAYTYTLNATASDEGTDTLTNIEWLQFGNITQTIEDFFQSMGVLPPVIIPIPDDPTPGANTLLSVTPVNQTLQVGGSIALSQIFPQSGWSDLDGADDIGWVVVQDRTSGGGYLTRNGVAQATNVAHTISVANLGEWAFVAATGNTVDEIGFNIVQADGDWSPRLNPGAQITTRTTPVVAPDDHSNSYSGATVIGSISSYTSAQGAIETAGDTDWFAVSLQAGQGYALMLWPQGSTNSHLDPVLTVRDQYGNQWTNDNLTASTLTSFVSLMAAQTGTYWIQARGADNTTGGYYLSLTPVVTDGSAGWLTPTTGNEDTTGDGGGYWHWQGTSGDDRPSTTALQASGYSVSGDNFYRGHDGDDRISAGSGNDVVWGDTGYDSLYGDDGQDTLRGGRNDDSLYGGTGDDLLYGESGDDWLNAGDGNDTIYGGSGDDRSRGYDGNDYIKGEDGDDDLNGSDGDDEIYGDSGADSLRGGFGNDMLFGGTGNDSLRGGQNEDRLAGESGNDTLEGSYGDDQLFGGDDDDTLVGGDGNDLLHGEAGNDTADFSDGSDGVTVNLFDEIATSDDLGTDTLYSIENVIGSNDGDAIDGDHGNNVLSGIYGDDLIRGHNGADTVSGGDGNDTVWGDADNDEVNGDAGNDEVRGGLGADTLFGGIGDDYLRGEQGNDSIDGGDGTDTVFFLGEHDDFQVFQPGNGTTIITDLRADGLEGQDTLSGVEFIEFFDGRASIADILAPAPTANADSVTTGSCTPILIDVLANDLAGASTATVTSVSVSSGGGSTYFVGGRLVYDPRGSYDSLPTNATEFVELTYTITSAGFLSSFATKQITLTSENELLDGTLSADHLFANGGADTIIGGAGNDTLYGGAGNDLLVGGTGNDRIDGGLGVDTAYFNGTTAAVVNLNLTTAQNTGYGLDTLLGIENLVSGSGNDRLTGNALANLLNGGAGNDRLLGGDGNDALVGGLGNDLLDGGAGGDRALFNGTTAAVVNLNLTTAQNTGYGLDTLLGIEHVTSGNGNDRLTGNALANSLSAGLGNDALNGGAGNDGLYGGAGNDLLVGGIGSDAFVFNTALSAGNIDRVTDFSVVDDTIRLENAIFTGLANGVLTAAAFVANATGLAGDASDRIIFETDTGNLFFDADGTGAAARVQFAHLNAGLALTNADFLVI